MVKSMIFDTSVARDVIEDMLDIEGSDPSFYIEEVLEHLGEKKMMLPPKVWNDIEGIIRKHLNESKDFDLSENSDLIDELRLVELEKGTDSELSNARNKYEKHIKRIQNYLIKHSECDAAKDWVWNKKKYLKDIEGINVSENMPISERIKALKKLRNKACEDIEILSVAMAYSDNHDAELVTNDGDMVMLEKYFQRMGTKLTIWRPQKK